MLCQGVQSLVGDGPASPLWKSSANSTIFHETIATWGPVPMLRSRGRPSRQR
jgi:hypothetical protein